MIDADFHEAEQQALGQLGRMDLALAAHLHALAMASFEPREVEGLARAYQRAARSARQTIMLRAWLRRAHAREMAGDAPRGGQTFAIDPLDSTPPAPQALSPEEARQDQRILDLQEAAVRIMAKASPVMPRPERLEALDRLDAWIDHDLDERPETFIAEDLDSHVLAMAEALDLPEPLARRFRDLPRPPGPDGLPPGAYDFEPPAEPAQDPAEDAERRESG